MPKRTVPTHSAYERIIYRRLKRQERQLLREGDTEEAAKLTWILTNGDAFQVACEQIISDSAVPTDDLDVVFYGEEEKFGVIPPLIMLITYLLANWESIYKIIQTIMDLWSKKEETGSEGA